MAANPGLRAKKRHQERLAKQQAQAASGDIVLKSEKPSNLFVGRRMNPGMIVGFRALLDQVLHDFDKNPIEKEHLDIPYLSNGYVRALHTQGSRHLLPFVIGNALAERNTDQSPFELPIHRIMTQPAKSGTCQINAVVGGSLQNKNVWRLRTEVAIARAAGQVLSHGVKGQSREALSDLAANATILLPWEQEAGLPLGYDDDSIPDRNYFQPVILGNIHNKSLEGQLSNEIPALAERLGPMISFLSFKR